MEQEEVQQSGESNESAISFTVAKKKDYVRLDVGSTLHLCHRDTLMKFPDSALAKCVGPEFDRRESELDFIVIDRDGKHFGAILNWMRNPNSLELTHWNLTALKELRGEADYYGLVELLEEIDQRLASINLEGFKVDEKRKLTVILDRIDVVQFCKQSKKPTFMFNVALLGGIGRYTVQRFIEHIDLDKFSVIFAYEEEMKSASASTQVYSVILVRARDVGTIAVVSHRTSFDAELKSNIYELLFTWHSKL